MIEKQKQAIVILNRIKESNAISDEEYFTLMEFVVEDKSPQIQYIPYYNPDSSSPFEVYPKVTYRGYETTVTEQVNTVK